MLIDFEKYTHLPTPCTEIHLPILNEKNLRLIIKRDELCHPEVSGNKLRKLKYQLLDAKQRGYNKLWTFGGAYSNHLLATAAAGHIWGFETAAFVRGNELSPEANPTLSHCNAYGMKMHFVDRESYRNKTELSDSIPEDYYHLPEGGSSKMALKGVAELLDEQEFPDYICTAVGTGGTLAGLSSHESYSGQVIGISVLKGAEYVESEILKLGISKESNFKIFHDYHFGAYGKYTDALISFMKDFEKEHHIPLEQVYTGKAMWGVLDLIEKNYFKPYSTILFLHTGGLQGRISSL
jgi:1-aminocyclopropane-1-carboxylate deaminase